MESIRTFLFRDLSQNWICAFWEASVSLKIGSFKWICQHTQWSIFSFSQQPLWHHKLLRGHKYEMIDSFHPAQRQQGSNPAIWMNWAATNLKSERRVAYFFCVQRHPSLLIFLSSHLVRRETEQCGSRVSRSGGERTKLIWRCASALPDKRSTGPPSLSQRWTEVSSYHRKSFILRNYQEIMNISNWC